MNQNNKEKSKSACCLGGINCTCKPLPQQEKEEVNPHKLNCEKNPDLRFVGYNKCDCEQDNLPEEWTEELQKIAQDFDWTKYTYWCPKLNTDVVKLIDVAKLLSLSKQLSYQQGVKDGKKQYAGMLRQLFRESIKKNYTSDELADFFEKESPLSITSLIE